MLLRVRAVSKSRLVVLSMQHVEIFALPVADPAAPATGRAATVYSSTALAWCRGRPPGGWPWRRRFRPYHCTRESVTRVFRGCSCRPCGTLFYFSGAHPGLTSGATICRPSGASPSQLRNSRFKNRFHFLPFCVLAFGFSLLSNGNIRRRSRVFLRMLPILFWGR
jgi:hypothetical protein